MHSNKVYANAKINVFSVFNVNATDELSKSYTAYWNVRKKLEELCKNKMIIIDTKISN